MYVSVLPNCPKMHDKMRKNSKQHSRHFSKMRSVFLFLCHPWISKKIRSSSDLIVKSVSSVEGEYLVQKAGDYYRKKVISKKTKKVLPLRKVHMIKMNYTKLYVSRRCSLVGLCSSKIRPFSSNLQFHASTPFHELPS